MASADFALTGARLINQIAEQWRRLRESAGRSHRGIRQYFAVLLISLGVLLSLYVGGTYFWMYQQQRQLMREFQTQNAGLNPSAPHVGGLTRLSIPKINLDAVIMEGTSHKSLTLGPAHLRDSAFPGDPGNSVLAAHRDTFFRHISELKAGDDIFVTQWPALSLRGDGKAHRSACRPFCAGYYLRSPADAHYLLSRLLHRTCA